MVSVADLAHSLLKLETVSPARGVIFDFLENALKPLGFAVQRLVFGEVENLFAWRGYEAPGRARVMFAGHVDVVPPGDRAAWRHPPFGGEVADGYLYGRGAVDMKGAVACMIGAVAQVGDVPVSVLITGDEEGPAVDGTVRVLEWMQAQGHGFDLCVLGEPTAVSRVCDTVKPGRRGSLSGVLTVHGIQGHVAYPERALNPLPLLLHLIAHLLSSPLDQGSGVFEPSNLEFVSIDTGNPSFNVIPARVEAKFNIRFNDLHTPAGLQQILQDRCAAFAPASERWSLRFLPCNAEAFVTETTHLAPLLGHVSRILGYAPALSTSGGTSDARFIKDYGPVIELGLVGQTMHQIDEHVPLADLELLTRVYEEILRFQDSSPA